RRWRGSGFDAERDLQRRRRRDRGVAVADIGFAECEAARRNARLDAADGAYADGIFRFGDAVYVNGRGRPARNEFVGVDSVHGVLYDGFGLCRVADNIPGRASARVFIIERIGSAYGNTNYNRGFDHFGGACLRRVAALETRPFVFAKERVCR